MSRIKLLEKMEVLENPDDEFKTNNVTGGSFVIKFPQPEPLRQPMLIEVKNLDFRYNKNDLEAPLLLKDVSVKVDMSSRIGLLGSNGCGKRSVLIRSFAIANCRLRSLKLFQLHPLTLMHLVCFC